MESRKKVSRSNVIVIAVTAAIFGWVLGPAAVNAAGSVVSLGWKGYTAKVTKSGSLHVDTGAPTFGAYPLGYAYTAPGGINAMATGNSNQLVTTEYGFLTGVLIDNTSSSASSKVTVTLTDAEGTVVYVGTASGGEHINDQIDNGVYWVGNLDVHVAGSGATYILYGVK